MALSCVFILSTIILIGMILLVPKREEKLHLASWIAISMMGVYLLWIFCVGWLNVTKISIGLESLLVVNLVASIILLGWCIYKKSIQKFSVDWIEVVILVAFFVGTLAMVIYRQGMEFSAFQYEADDSARHYEDALKLFRNHKLSEGRYALYLVNAIIMWAIGPVVDDFSLYKAFSYTDVCILFLSITMMWVAFWGRAKSWWQKLVSVVVSVVVLLFFTWNVILYGFGYLGAGVLVVIALIALLENYQQDKISLGELIPLLMLVNTALCVSYSLYAPAVYIGEGIYFLLHLRKAKRLLSFYTVLLAVLSVGIPMYLCVSYIAASLLDSYKKTIIPALLAVVVLAVLLYVIVRLWSKKTGATYADVMISLDGFLEKHRIGRLLGEFVVLVVGLYFVYRFVYIGLLLKAVAMNFHADGSIYRNAYGDFVWLFFPIVIHVVNCLRDKKNDALLWILFGTLGFSAWFVRYIMYGLVGTYYFYKMHFMLWPLAWAIVYKVIVSLKKETLYYAGIYAAMVIGLLGIHVTGAEKRFAEYSYFLWPDTMLDQFFGIYDYNMELLKQGGTLSEELLEVTHAAYDIMQEEDTFIPIFGDEVKYYKDYFYVLSWQDRYKHPHWLFDENRVSENIVQSLKDVGAGYICVNYDYFEYGKLYANEFMCWDMVWTNMDYAIYRVPEGLMSPGEIEE